MKKSVLFLLTFVLIFISSNEVIASSNQSTDDAIQVAHTYFNTIVKESADGSDGIPLKDYKIVKVDSSEKDIIKLSVALTYDEFGTLPVAPYEVIKTNGEYQVKHEIVTFDSDPESPNYGMVELGNRESAVKDSGNIRPNAVISGSYYRHTIYGQASPTYAITTYLTGQSWSNTKSNITINGAQEKLSGEDLLLSYGVAAYLGGGNYNKLKSSSYLSGDYPKNGANFNVYLTGVPLGDSRCIFVKSGASSKALVTGNAYE